MAGFPPQELCKPSPAVREINTKDGAVLLDVRQSLCLSMRPFSLRVWRLLTLGHTVAEIVDSLSREFEHIPAQEVQNNVLQFVESLRQKSLLQEGETQPKSDTAGSLLKLVSFYYKIRERKSNDIRLPRFLTLKALLGLLVFDLLRFANNFPKIHNFVRMWPVASGNVPPEIGAQLCAAVNYACVWYPKRIRCLQRSFVTTCLARTCGLRATMVLAAQALPFKAHAWTEIDGIPVNERRTVRKFLVWERC
jgi:hypothetical protein